MADKKNKKESKKSINKKNIINIFIIIIIFLVAGILGMVFYRVTHLATDSEIVTTIYEYMGNNNLDMCSGLVTYDDEEVTSDSLEETTKICMAYSLVESSATTITIDKSKNNNTCSIGDELIFATDNYEDDICTLTKISASTINDKYRLMYGSEIEEYLTYQIDGANICYYNSEDDSYYCGLSESYTYTIGAEPHTYRTIEKVVKSGDNLYIYDYFIKVISDTCYTSYVNRVENDECTNNYSEDEEITYKFLKKYGTYYKHTYKKDGDNYYWVSSSPE